MGTIYDDLPNHEGFAAHRLPDGTITTTRTRSAPWVAACSCGWHDNHDQPATDQGAEDALDRWDQHHARPLLDRAVPPEVSQLVDRTRAAVAHLVHVRPNAAAEVLARIDRWSGQLRRLAQPHQVGTPTVQDRLDAFAQRQRREPPGLGL